MVGSAAAATVVGGTFNDDRPRLRRGRSFRGWEGLSPDLAW